MLSFWDTENHPDGWVEMEPFSRFQTEQEIQRYLDYVRFIVGHFKDRVKYFEIWNEPDNTYPIQYIKLPDYINLVKRVAPVIRQESPEAKIVVGSVASLRHTDFLFRMIESDEIMPLVDVIAWHPFYGDSPAYEQNRQYYYDYPSIVQQIKDTATAHGFRGEFRADEITYFSPEFPEGSRPTHSELQCAKYWARGVVLHLGMDVGVRGSAPGSGFRTPHATWRYLCTVMAGAKPDTVSFSIQTADTSIKSYSFSLPSDKKLLVLWTDGVAVDDDPGVQSTLTINGMSNHSAMAIDVLHGFEQQLVTETKEGNMVIRNLLVKDYPILLRLAPNVATHVPQTAGPLKFSLSQNFPNPFNPSTVIRYSIPVGAIHESPLHVTLKVYNVLGQEIATLVNKELKPGSYEASWEAGGMASGVYFYRLQAGSFVETRKLVLLR
jgi:hypothetical protein